MSDSSTDCGATSTAAATGECPQTDSDKPVKFVDLHLCESEDSSSVPVFISLWAGTTVPTLPLSVIFESRT